MQVHSTDSVGDLDAWGDHALIASAQTGDRQALEALLRRHRGAIERLCRRLCSDPSQVDDVIQETHVAILRNLPAFRGDAGFLTWVYTIARTHRGRATRAARRDRGRGEVLRNLAHVLPTGRSLDEVLAGRELTEALQRALAPLRPIDRTIAWMRDVEGCSAAEIADKVGLTVPAVKTRLHRARVVIRGELESLRQARLVA